MSTETEVPARGPAGPAPHPEAVAGDCVRRTLRSWFAALDWPVLLAILVFSAGLTGANLGGPYVLHFIDILWPLNPGGYLLNLGYSWNSVNQGTFTFVNAFNLPLAAWLDLLGLLGAPTWVQEFLTLTLLQTLGGYGFFVLVRRFVVTGKGTTSYFIAVASAFAYLVNYYALTVGWWDNVPGFFFLLGFGPPFLYSALRLQSDLLAGRRPRPATVSFLALSSFFAFSTNVPFNLSLVALAILLPPFELLRPQPRPVRVRSLLVEYLLLGTLIVATSLWWIVPDYLQSVFFPSYVSGGYSTAYNLSLFSTSSSSLTLLTVLTGLFGVEYPAYAHTALANALYIGLAGSLALLVGLVVVGAAVLAPRGRPRARQAYLLGAVLVLSLFFMGVNSPIRPVLQYLLESNSIALQALRNPFLTFGFAMCVLVTLAFAHGVEVLVMRVRSLAESGAARSSSSAQPSPSWRRRGTRTHAAVALAVVVVVFLPLLSAGAPGLVGNAVPEYPFEARMAIPSYEYDVANYLQQHLNDSYALLYPGGFLEQNWTHGYDGYDILPSLLPQAFLIYDAGSGFVASPNPMLSYAYSAIQSGTTDVSNFSSLMNRLGVSIIVVEGEVGGSYPFGFNAPPDYPLILGSLNQTPGLRTPLTFGPDYVYTTYHFNPVATSATDSVLSEALLTNTTIPEVNLTSLYANASAVSTPLAPTPAIPLTASRGGFTAQANASEKASLAAHPLGSPLGEFQQPIVFNGAPIPISTDQYDSISVTFSTNANTAITISVVNESDLVALNSTSLATHMFVLGGPASNLGYGTTALFPAYGADHLWTDGRIETLTDDLRQTLLPSSSDTIDYLLFSMFPVENGSGTPGVPVADWVGTQSFTIASIVLGNPFYASPIAALSPVAMSIPGGVAIDNLTRAYVAGVTAQNSTEAPPHNFLPVTSAGFVNATLNQTVKSMIASTPLRAPFGSAYPPSVFNSVPEPMTLADFGYFTLSFLTNSLTAVTASLLTTENLTAIPPSDLANVTVPLGGPGNSLGYGTPALFPAYGADHFSTGGNLTVMSQQLDALEDPTPLPQAYYLILSLFPVAANGSGLRFLPVQDWPGVQQLNVYGLALSNYLVDGRAAVEPPSFFGPAPRANWVGPDPFDPTTAVVSEPLPALVPAARVSVTPESPVSFDVMVEAPAPSAGPFLIILRQSYAVGWQVGGPEVARAVHLPVDASYNGFLLYLDRNVTETNLTFTFSGQADYATALGIGFGAASAAILLPPALAGMGLAVRRARRGR